MADLSFDTPQTSSIYTQRFTGTIPAHNDQGYLRLTVTVTNSSSRNDIYYRTIPISPSPTGTQRSWSGTYNIVITPKKLATDNAAVSAPFVTFTAQQ